jgi:hypothetical protein
MSHPWFRVALVTLLALTDLIVYFYETGRRGSRLLLVFTHFLSFNTNPKSIMPLSKMLCSVLKRQEHAFRIRQGCFNFRNTQTETGKGSSEMRIIPLETGGGS